MSLLPTYKQLFCAKVFGAAFLLLQFGFVIFWQKKIGAKAAHKMLVKITSVVNFTKILRAAFMSINLCWNFKKDRGVIT